MLGPAFHAGLEKGAINDELTAAVEQVKQGRLAVGAVELVLLLHRQPRHPSTLGRQRVAGARQLFLFHEKLLSRSLPFLRRHHFPAVHFAHVASLTLFPLDRGLKGYCPPDL